MCPLPILRLSLSAILAISSLALTGCPDDGSSPATSLITHQAYLKAPNAEGGDHFGVAVATSGETLVVGAYHEDSNQTTITNGTTIIDNDAALSAGAVYVFVRSGTTWAQQAYLKAPNAGGGDQFGYAVGISGDTIVVGAVTESSNQTTITNGATASTDNSANFSGAAYVFVRNGTTWTQQAYLKAPNTEAFDNFGQSVSISSDTIVVGASSEDSNQTTITNGATASSDNLASGAGAAYVFVRSGTTWTQQAYLKAPNAEAGDTFGWAVGISGDTIVVGALSESSNQTTITNGATIIDDDSAFGAGAAYVFVRSSTTWSHQAYLKAPNAETVDQFAWAVAVSGDTIVVSTMSEDSNQTTITNGATVVDDNSAPSAGAAYVFVRSGTTWSHQAYLKAPNAGGNDQFGYAVAISGDTIVVGAGGEDSNQTTITNGATVVDDNSAPSAGAAYVFVRNGTTWTQQAYLKAPNAESSDNFGQSVAISGETMVVGAWNEDSSQATITHGATASADNSATDAGAAYVFTIQ